MKYNKVIKKMVLAILLLGALNSNAQELRISTYASYTLSNSISGYSTFTDFYDGRLKSTYLWGAGLELSVDAINVEIKYLHGDAKAPVTHYDNGTINYPNFDVSMNYILLNPKGTFFDDVDNLEAYVGLNIGAAWFEFKSPIYPESRTIGHVAWGVNAGVNYWFTDRIGAKFQAEMISTIEDLSIFASFGTGGAGVGVSTSSSFYQLNFGGGLIFRLTSKY